MNPILVNVWRGNAIENYHSGAVAVVDSRGRIIWSIGEIQRPIFPRSAIKILQTLVLVDSRVEKKFDISKAELALSCSSHTGERIHCNALEGWLDKIGCDEEHLECGASYPQLPVDYVKAMKNGQGARRAFHCCSGNHTGYLTLCKVHKEAIQNYRLYNHPAQRRWFDVVGDLTDLQPLQLPWGYDGCGIPTLAIPLQRLAKAYARFASPGDLSPELAEASLKIQEAIAENPTMFGGTGELTTAIAQSMAPKLIAKNGAEGVYIACLPELGYGIALKIDSGNAQAARVVLGAVLQKIAAISDEQISALGDYFRPDVFNTRNEAVGRAEPSSAWDQGVLRF